MHLSARVQNSKESITLKMNERISKLSQTGKLVYNMTQGELPFKPSIDFIKSIEHQLNFLKSYQYCPSAGFVELRDKFKNQVEQKRNIKFDNDISAIISNGSKHSLYNLFGSIIDKDDEVVMIAPFWVSYPEMIKFWGGVPKVIKTNSLNAFSPHLEDLEKLMSPKTKAIIINSPCNPAGTFFDREWMKNFAEFMKNYPNVVIVSDELYSELNYFDPAPSYFYQFDSSLLSQTVIVNGISKSLASTGLRIGYAIGPQKIIDAMITFQSQTSSGPSSLIQRALIEFDFQQMDNFLIPIKIQLRECSQILMDKFREAGFGLSWYQTTAGFYYFIDFEKFPVFKKYKSDKHKDISDLICQDLLEKFGVALVPGENFGLKNTARMSMTLELAPFAEAIDKLIQFLQSN